MNSQASKLCTRVPIDRTRTRFCHNSCSEKQSENRLAKKRENCHWSTHATDVDQLRKVFTACDVYEHSVFESSILTRHVRLVPRLIRVLNKRVVSYGDMLLTALSACYISEAQSENAAGIVFLPFAPHQNEFRVCHGRKLQM